MENEEERVNNQIEENGINVEEANLTEENMAEGSAEATAEEAANDADKKGGKKPMSKKKRIISAVLLALQIVLVVIALVICLVVMITPKDQDEVSSLGVKLLPVLTASMDGDKKDSFPKGALVVATTPKNGGKDLKVGDIVTFKQLEGGKMVLVTHRITAVEKRDGTVYYTTQGDNWPIPDAIQKVPADILAVYSFHIKGLGSAMIWIRNGYNFIYVVIIPLGLLLIYNMYLVAQIIVEARMKKAKAVAAQSALASVDEEAIKRKAIEEYLRQQAEAAQAAKDSEDKKE